MDYLSPIEALFPGVGAAVLAVLSETEEPLTIRQVAERAGATHPQVASHLERFEALGVVSRRVVGRSHLVTLTDSAASELVRSLSHLRDAVLDRMRATADAIEPPAQSIIVFGSFARGTATAESDVDIAVVAPPGRADDEAWLASLSSWLDRVSEFAGNPVAEIVVADQELAERVSEPLWEEIRREGIVASGASLGEIMPGRDAPSATR